MVQNKAVTIYDVAKKAGVSPATVSRVLNEPSRVNEEKRDRVLDAINELKFVPKAEAVANARSGLKRIGVIAPFFTEPSFMQRLRGISRVLSARHYEMVVYSLESARELEEYVDMLCSSRRVDGLIVLSLNLSVKSVEKLRESRLPVCFVESGVDGFDSVSVDNEEGGFLAAKYLYDLGCRHPAFFGEKSERPYAVRASEKRLDGYRKFFSEKKIQIKKNHIWLGENTEENILFGVNEFLSQKNLPDCIFASSDVIAIKLVEIANSKKIKVPEQIKIIGFDNIDFSRYLNISTVTQNLDESGRLAAERVLARIEDSDREAVNARISLSVIARESTELSGRE